MCACVHACVYACVRAAADRDGEWWSRRAGSHHDDDQLRETTVDDVAGSQGVVRLSQQQSRHCRRWSALLSLHCLSSTSL